MRAAACKLYSPAGRLSCGPATCVAAQLLPAQPHHGYRPNVRRVAYKMDDSPGAYLLRRLPRRLAFAVRQRTTAARGTSHLDARLCTVRRACGLRVPLLSSLESRGRLATHG